MINIVFGGVALASLWMWIYLLIKKKEFDTQMLKWWIGVIVPQGILIMIALILLGII